MYLKKYLKLIIILAFWIVSSNTINIVTFRVVGNRLTLFAVVSRPLRRTYAAVGTDARNAGSSSTHAPLIGATPRLQLATPPGRVLLVQVRLQVQELVIYGEVAHTTSEPKTGKARGGGERGTPYPQGKSQVQGPAMQRLWK